METKTVTELAGLFGVSRQAMNKRVRALQEDYLEKNQKGFTVVNEAGVRELERLYEKVVTAKQEVIDQSILSSKQDKTLFAMLSNLMEGKEAEIERLHGQIITKDQQLQMLGNQLETKDNQLEAKDQQIAQKDKQLNHQLQLTAVALQEREQILLELKKEKKSGFFARIFNK
ncbi:MAG: DUF536 domain-containing protein [Lactovum sp.]